MGIQHAIQALVQNQKTPTPFATSLAAPIPQFLEPIREELAQGAIPNTNHLSAARGPISAYGEQIIFITKAEVVSLVRQKKKRVLYCNMPWSQTILPGVGSNKTIPEWI